MKDNLEKRFDQLKGQFDIEEPLMGHFDRFETKLAMRDVSKPKTSKKSYKWIAIAASVALLLGVLIGNYNGKQSLQLADVSPEMQDTQHFFVSAIQTEIEAVNRERNPDNAKIIDDAFEQLTILENNYGKLTVELQKSDKDKRIIYAMIANFQQRIEVLQNLLDELEQLKTIKNNVTDETII